MKNIDYKSGEWLYDQYWNKGKTLKQMGDVCKVNQQTILNWMKGFNIGRKGVGFQPGNEFWKNSNSGFPPEHRLKRGESSFNAFYKRYKWSAKKKDMEFDFTKEEFRKIVEKNCFYCNVPPNTPHSHSRDSYGDYYSNGIDRVDNSIGYTHANSRPCCTKCNRAKHALGEDEFRVLIVNIYNHFILGENNAI